MKSLKCVLIAVLIIILIYSSISCSDQSINKQKTIVLESTCKTFPNELLSESSKVIADRLRCINISNFTIDEDIYQSRLIIKLDDKGDTQLISMVLTEQGTVNFQETHKREDVLMNLHKGLSTECNQKLDSLLGITTDKKYPDAIIGQANSRDTFAINKFFRSKAVKSMLPSNIKFCWSKYVSESNRLELYAVSTEKSGIDKTSIEGVRVSKDAKYISVLISFKQEYYRALEDLTKRSMDKSIAFLVDGRVYSAPIVKSVISGGKVEVTGGFSEEEANRLVAIISCGELPLDFQIK